MPGRIAWHLKSLSPNWLVGLGDARSQFRQERLDDGGQKSEDTVGKFTSFRVVGLSQDVALRAGEVDQPTVRAVGESVQRGQRGPGLYIVVEQGELIREDDVHVIHPTAPPEGVGEGERWIDIDLEHQVLVAYDWKQPRYVTLVSTGRTKTPSPELDYLTPRGLHRIRGKHLTSTMDNDEPGEPPYSLEDVPYVMYFYRDYAIHGTYWHSNFGTPMSHGCVNLATPDAQWIFNWSTYGTVVNVHY